MFVLINGAFGIGKTTVSRELRALVSGAAIFDPEWIGLLLQQVPGYGVSDFQHLKTWRRATVLGARMVHTVRPTVLVPMTFSGLTYLREVVTGLAKSGHTVLHFCLTAPLDVVRERLANARRALWHRAPGAAGVRVWQIMLR